MREKLISFSNETELSNVLNMLLSADGADQLSDGAWVTRAATLGVVTRTSLTQAVPGRSR